MEGPMYMARKIRLNEPAGDEQQISQSPSPDLVLPRDVLLDIKMLGYANRRSELRATAARVADAAGLPSSHSVDEPDSIARATSIGQKARIVLFTVLAVSTVLILHHLTKYGTFPTALFGVFVAATVSSTVGFAFSAIAAAILLHIITDKIAVVEIMLISSIALQTYGVVALWRDIRPVRVGWFLLGGILTLPLGVYMLLVLNTPSYAMLIGLFLAVYGTVTLWRPARSISHGGPITDTLVGSTGGIVGPLVAFPGAIVAIWCGVRGWDKSVQRGIYQPYILVMQMLTLAVLAYLGETTHIDATYAIFVVPATIGAHIGFRVFQNMTDGQFRKVVNILLIISGFGILGRALQ